MAPSARYLDHVTVATPNMHDDIAFYKTLGQRHTAQIDAEPGFTVFSTTTCNGIRSTHDLGLVPDFGATGRANHIAYNVDQRLDVERAAEVFMAHDTPIEFGPGIHGLDEITYLYVREPGGFRIEINAGGWENAMPDWKATDLEPHAGRHDALEERADARVDDGVLAADLRADGAEGHRGLSVHAPVRRKLIPGGREQCASHE